MGRKLRRGIPAATAVVVLLSARTPEDDNTACSVQLDKEQDEVATRVVGKLDQVLGTLRLAVEDDITPSSRRDVRTALKRLQRAKTELDGVFSQGCV